jgi:hypothetical protein
MSLEQRHVNPWRQIAAVTKFCVLAPNVFKSSEMASGFLEKCLHFSCRCSDTDRGKPKYSVKCLSQCFFLLHIHRMDWLVIEPGSLL